MLPGPDMLLMLVFTSVTYLLVRRVVATKSPQPSYDHLAIGLLLGGGILIRTEMIVLGPVIAIIWIAFVQRPNLALLRS